MVRKPARITAIAALGIITAHSAWAQKIIQTPTHRSVTLSLNEAGADERVSVYDLSLYNLALSDSLSGSLGAQISAHDGISGNNLSSPDPALPATTSIVKSMSGDARAESANSEGKLFFGVPGQTAGSDYTYSPAVGVVPESGITSLYAALVFGSAVSSILLRKRRKSSVVGDN